jgi:hypothetical protein
VVLVPMIGAAALAWRVWTNANFPYVHKWHL